MSSFSLSEEVFNIDVIKSLNFSSFSYSKDLLHFRHFNSNTCSHSSPVKSAPPGLPMANFVIVLGSSFFSATSFFLCLIFSIMK